MGRPAQPALQRFWSKVRRGPGCWEWAAGVDKNGYGQFWAPAIGAIRAHRYSYLAFVKSTIPDSLQVLHHCDNTGCVRPPHLFLGTPAANMEDKVAKGRGVTAPGVAAAAAKNRAKTHCPRGHEYSEQNTYRHGTSRYCRTCKNDRQRAEYRRIRSVN